MERLGIEFLSVFGLPISLEVPNRSQVEAGLSPHERLGQSVDAAKNLLAELAELDRRDQGPQGDR